MADDGPIDAVGRAKADEGYLDGDEPILGPSSREAAASQHSPYSDELARLRRRERDLLEQKRLCEVERLRGPEVSKVVVDARRLCVG